MHTPPLEMRRGVGETWMCANALPPWVKQFWGTTQLLLALYSHWGSCMSTSGKEEGGGWMEPGEHAGEMEKKEDRVGVAGGSADALLTDGLPLL